MSRNSSVSTAVSALNADSSRHYYHRLSQDPLRYRGTSPAPREEISRQHTNGPADETVNILLCDIGRRYQVTDDEAGMFFAVKGFRVQLMEEKGGWRFYKVE